MNDSSVAIADLTSPLDNLLDKKYQRLSPSERCAAPVYALKGVSEADGQKLAKALQIHTVRDLAEHWAVRAAQAILEASHHPPPEANDPTPSSTSPLESPAPESHTTAANLPELELEPRAAVSVPSIPFPGLSEARYGYDFIVALPSKLINVGMQNELASLNAPWITVVWLKDKSDNPVQVNRTSDAILARWGTLFDWPEGAAPPDSMVEDELGIFWFGFRARLGLPPGVDPAALPDMVTLGTNTARVGFTLLFAEFQVIELRWGPRGGTFINRKQPSGQPWTFGWTVDLRLAEYDRSAFSALPPDVQSAIRGLGGNPFSVQQLLFNLDNAALQSDPQVTGVDTTDKAYRTLVNGVLGAYFQAMKSAGHAMFGYQIQETAAPATSLVPTALNYSVNPLMGTNGVPLDTPDQALKDCTSLIHLCATGGKPLPPPVQFPCNWTPFSAFGVVVINRNTLRDYLQGPIIDQARRNCYNAHVRVWLDTIDMGLFDMPTGSANYEWSLSGGQQPNIDTPPTGPRVLTLSYSSESYDEAGAGGGIGRMRLRASYSLDINFVANTIVITQQLVIYTMVRSLATEVSGNVVNKTITDTYSIAVDGSGALGVRQTGSSTDDQSQSPGTNDFLNFWTGVNSLADNVRSWASNCVATQLRDIPVGAIRSFVFPGGKSFKFRTAAFNDNQDLMAQIYQ